MAGSDHWNSRYESTGAASVSWFEQKPEVSLALLDELGVTAADSVIDIGGGASTLVDHLLARGHRDLGVLDLSTVALDEARRRLPPDREVRWIEHDLLSWKPDRRWSVWHDRAVLHFLTADEDRATYAQLLRQTVEPHGGFVIGVFADDGPTECSGLPVRRYTPDELVELIGDDVEVVAQRHQLHCTPAGVEQSFNWLAGRLHP